MEHLQHFGLSQDPFQNEPDLRFYFESGSHSEPHRRVERGLRQNKGLTVLTGEGGSGKTLLSRRILEALEEEVFEATLMVMLPGATNAEDVLGRFARQIGVEEPASERAALLAQVYERLAMIREEGRHAVLILDDAHLLDRESLSEIGGLLNLEYEDRRLLSLLLIGVPELDVALSHDACLGQRVDVRARIVPLTLQDTASYLLHRIAYVGGQADILSEEAIGALYKFGRGRPRLLNTLADNALFEAYLGGRRKMNAEDIERAASDLGIGLDPGTTYGGPLPMDASSVLEGDSVDFGLGAAPDLGSSASGLEDEAVMGEITDPAGAMSFDSGHEIPGLESSSGDVIGLLEEVDAGSSEELTTVHVVESQPEVVLDLDAAVEGILDEEPGAVSLGELEEDLESLPVFEAENSADFADAGATRIAFEEEQPAVSGGEDELDDLFVELLEE